MNRIRAVNLVLFCYWVVLFCLTHIPVSLRMELRINHLDKVFHFAAFAGLAFLLGWVLSQNRQITFANGILVFLTASVYAACDEWTQAFVPGRDPDVWDAAADIVGAFAGLLFLVVMFLAMRDSVASSPLASKNEA